MMNTGLSYLELNERTAVIRRRSGNSKPDLETRLKQILVPGERLLWFGQPDGRFRYQSNDIVRAILSIPLLFIGWFVVREALATRDVRREGIGVVSDMTLALLIAGATVLTLLGLYRVLFVGHLLDARSRSRTSFGITDRRIVIPLDSNPYPARSFAIEPIDSISVEPGPAGTGTVVIQSAAEGWHYPWACRGCKFPIGLRWIDNPVAVRDLISATQTALLATNQHKPWSWTAFQIGLVLQTGESLQWSGSRMDRSVGSVNQSVYGVTDRRVICLPRLDLATPISAVFVKDISKVDVMPNPDRDYGTVRFSRVVTPYPDSGELESGPADLQFIAAGDAQNVAAIVNEARRAQFHRTRLRPSGARHKLLELFPNEEFHWIEQHSSVASDHRLMFTIAGISDRRAVVVERRLDSVQVKSLPLASIRELDFVLHVNGYGTVACKSTAEAWSTQFHGNSGHRSRLFYPVRNPEFVLELMIDTMASIGLTVEPVGGNVVRVFGEAD